MRIRVLLLSFGWTFQRDCASSLAFNAAKGLGGRSRSTPPKGKRWMMYCLERISRVRRSLGFRTFWPRARWDLGFGMTWG